MTFREFLIWCSKADRYPDIPHISRAGKLARFYSEDNDDE